MYFLKSYDRNSDVKKIPKYGHEEKLIEIAFLKPNWVNFLFGWPFHAIGFFCKQIDLWPTSSNGLHFLS
jgi:hypothetical protein